MEADIRYFTVDGEVDQPLGIQPIFSAKIYVVLASSSLLFPR